MNDFYQRAAAGLPDGHSSFFETPHRSLDPNLFDGTHLRPEVRARLLVILKDGLNEALNLAGIDDWLHAWIAGSGITYQWEGGEGDLDVLFGVTMHEFVMANPIFQGIPEDDIATWADDLLRSKLWPQSAKTVFGKRTYEVTFFWNPGTHDHIENIKPYAAYNLTAGQWDVEPPVLPQDPASLYPREWFEAAGRDTVAASRIVSRYTQATDDLSSLPAGSPHAVNAEHSLVAARALARTLFDEIHHGRRAAFAPGGTGYGDWSNFRWQLAKETGAIKALRTITEAADEERKARETSLYGGPIDGPNVLLMRDMMRPRPS
jgi:hypothetical protein